MLRARMSDAETEARAVQQRLTLEKGKVRESGAGAAAAGVGARGSFRVGFRAAAVVGTTAPMYHIVATAGSIQGSSGVNRASHYRSTFNAGLLAL